MLVKQDFLLCQQCFLLYQIPPCQPLTLLSTNAVNSDKCKILQSGKDSRIENITLGKKTRQCQLLAFPPFSMMFSNCFVSVEKTGYCAVKLKVI